MPRPLLKIARRILGARYELSLAFVSPREIAPLNMRYRNVRGATDILSFPFSKNSGEMLICKSEVRKRAPRFGMSASMYLCYLVIHGALHLKGHDHGRIMEKLEDRWCRLLGIPLPKR